MRKGIQKNMIWIRTPESARYESAYLVLRPRIPQEDNAALAADFVREAQQILSDSDPLPKKTRFRHPGLLWFLLGLLTGILSLLLLLFLLWLGAS